MKNCQYHLTFPLQVIAIVDEFQRVCLFGSVNVIYVDVQVVRRFQVVIGEHRPLALIQGEVHVGRDQSATLALSHGLSHIQSGGRVWTGGQQSFGTISTINLLLLPFNALTGSIIGEAT